MKKIICVIFLLIGNTSYATVETGNSFIQSYESKSNLQQQYLIGYVAGMYDAYEIADKSIMKCLGSNVKMSQIVDALGIYLKNNPQIRHHRLYDIYPIAIKEIFKCN